MDLKYLQTIRTIHQTGSFQKAANALNYAQSTVTFHVRQVEKELHTVLFVKQGRQMVLSAAGQQLMPLIDQLLANADQLTHFQTPTDALVGSLTLAVPETLLTYQLQPVLKAFKQQAPNVQLTIKVLNCYDIFAQMVDHQVDVAVHYDVRQYANHVAVMPLHTYPLVLVCSPDLTQTERDFSTPHQTKALCHIQNDPHARYLELFQQYLTEQQIHLAPALELWSIESIKQSVMSNLGVAFLPRFTVINELQSGSLIELPTTMTTTTLNAVVAYDQSQPQSPAARLMVDLLKQSRNSATINQ